MMIATDKMYDNTKGYFYIPVVWREEFNLQRGSIVGIDINDNILVIDQKIESRQFKQTISAKGKLTIPIELRSRLLSPTYNIMISQAEKQLLLIPSRHF